MVSRDKNKYLIQSVSMACSLLEQFYGAPELRITELSRLLDINKNNVFRLLATLETHNFIEQNQVTGAYRLGFANLKLGETCLRNKRLEHESRLLLEDVSCQSLETTILAAFGTGGLVCVDVVESILPVRVIYHAGTILPLHCSSLEEIFHDCSGEKMKGILCRENIKQYKKPTSAPARSLAMQLLDIREKGFAISVDELEAGVNGVAAPIRNHASRIIGLLGVVGPGFRLTHERLNDEVASLVVRAAGDISLRMGYGKTVERNVISQ